MGELVKRDTIATAQIMGEEQFDNVFRMAKALAASKTFKDVTQAEQAFARILLGADLGLTPTQALMNIDVVEGNARVRSNQLAAWVRKSEHYDYSVVEHDADHCVIDFYYKGEAEGQSAFTIEDAKNAGLVKDHPKSAWKAHPRNMLWARAMSNGVRWFCPDLTGGIAVYTEADDFTDSTAVEIGAGEGSGEAPGWEGLDEETVAKIEALVQVANDFGNHLDLATLQMRLNGKPEAADEWLVDTQDMLAKGKEATS